MSWADTYTSLSKAEGPLGPDDLELLATSAYMLGRDDEYVETLARAHQVHLENGEPLRAARCAFWAGIDLLTAGEPAQANGWFARAERLVDRQPVDCVERGYLLIPVLLQRAFGGDHRGAHDTAAEAAAIGERFGDRDLVALTVQEQGHALVRLGRVDEGLRLIDEAMVAVTTGELSPIVTGLIYCNTIAFCHGAHELARAREWTGALSRWCEEQPDMVAHTGVCLVHRAEVMQLSGEWSEALAEARSAGKRFARSGSAADAGRAHYREGELHRLRGELDAAEGAYRRAARCGWEPQPGLALLRLAQGRADTAAVAIRRALGETSEPVARRNLLPAAVEILVAAGASGEAGEACAELERIAAGHADGMPAALAAHARGIVDLAGGDARSALVELRRACREWERLCVPYEAARARLEVGVACREIGDADSAAFEFDAAREAFATLGAASDLARAEALTRPAAPGGAHGLTAREVEVLRLVAEGMSNREIAAELTISEHTVARHVQNILAKLRLRSRTAASAFAFEHHLV
jgi:DNA-binding CsgD family transcriptional regulator